MTEAHRHCLRLDHAGALAFDLDELPKAQPGQSEVRVALAGICSTDRLVVRARRDASALPPSLAAARDVEMLGHEIVGWREEGTGERHPVVVVPAERSAAGDYHCLGLAAGSHGGWGTLVIAEDWGLIPIPSIAPRYVLADALAPGFGLARELCRESGRIGVLGLGPLGLGVLWALLLAGRDDVVGIDSSKTRLRRVQELLPGATVTPKVQRFDHLVCAVPTDILTPAMVAQWVGQGTTVWAFTHPTWPVGDRERGVRWLHAPDADHSEAVRALALRDDADSLVDVVPLDVVITSGCLPDERSALRTAIDFTGH